MDHIQTVSGHLSMPLVFVTANYAIFCEILLDGTPFRPYEEPETRRRREAAVKWGFGGNW